MPLHKQVQVFEAFAQADGSVSRKYGGTGLGLAISARLVDMMGGQMQLTSEEGRGSTFSFTVQVLVAGQQADARMVAPTPLVGLRAPVTAHDGTDQRSIGRQPAAASEPPPAPSSSPVALRLLVAEDNIVNQRLAAAMLRRRGHDPLVVSNGREAIEAWKREPFAAIFMDIQMPEVDGYEATATIRAGERDTGAHIPIVAMTAHAMSGDRERCLEAGMDDYITKPVSLAELDRVLHQLASVAAA